MTKVRIDKYLVDTEQIENRSKVKNLVRQDLIEVNSKLITKPGFLIDPEKDEITIKPHDSYVSRSAHKLADALTELKIDIADLVCADIGASTGGFTEVLLKHNVKKVYAIDVGSGQIHDKISQDPRVENIENTNAREELPIPKVDFMVADLSFISASKYTVNLFEYLTHEGVLLLMFKPQFEVGQDNIRPNGVVKNQKIIQEALKNYESFLHKNKLHIRKLLKTTLLGKRGNQEYFILITR